VFVLLLNPPSREIVIRDNFCSKVSQAAYINHPIDLLVQSGFLGQEFEVHLVDAVIEKLSPDLCLDRMVWFRPHAIFSLAGNASWDEDSAFFRSIRHRLPDVKLIAGGDVFLDDPERCLEEKSGTGCDCLRLHDPGSPALSSKPDQGSGWTCNQGFLRHGRPQGGESDRLRIFHPDPASPDFLPP